MNMKALVAEFFGTMALIIAGVGVIVNGNGNSGQRRLGPRSHGGWHLRLLLGI